MSIMLDPVSQFNLAESNEDSQTSGKAKSPVRLWITNRHEAPWDDLQTESTQSNQESAQSNQDHSFIDSPHDLFTSDLPASDLPTSDLTTSNLDEPMLSTVLDDEGAKNEGVKKVKRRSLPRNFFLKRLDARYWRRLLRYLYIRFLRIRSSPEAIARGIAAGAFAGSFPLLGFQSLIGVTLAAFVRGNKMVAVAGTWISNPITFVPLFALNFHIGRWLLRLPTTTALPPVSTNLSEWMTMGLDVVSAIMVGSVIVGLVTGVVGYYVGLMIAQRVRRAKTARRRR